MGTLQFDSKGGDHVNGGWEVNVSGNTTHYRKKIYDAYLSFDDAYDSIYCEEDRDDIKAYVDEHIAVAK